MAGAFPSSVGSWPASRVQFPHAWSSKVARRVSTSCQMPATVFCRASRMRCLNRATACPWGSAGMPPGAHHQDEGAVLSARPPRHRPVGQQGAQPGVRRGCCRLSHMLAEMAPERCPQAVERDHLLQAERPLQAVSDRAGEPELRAFEDRARPPQPRSCRHPHAPPPRPAQDRFADVLGDRISARSRAPGFHNGDRRKLP